MRIAKLRAWSVIVFGAVVAWGVVPAAAHEFWVAPERYTVEPGDRVVATLRNGQMMRGNELPYLSSWFHAFTVTTENGTRDVEGFEGDMPALSYTAAEPGLNVIAYHSTVDRVTYDDGERFRKYLAYEGLEGIAEAHRARGLPDSGFTEEYSRFAKALVQVGPVGERVGERVAERDRDAALGLRFELVAENNPYATGAETVMVSLLREGEPVAGRQIAVFRCAGDVTRTLVNTDEQGRAAIPIRGGGEFLLNAVDIRAVDIRPAEKSDGTGTIETDPVVWASDWASLTFGTGTMASACPQRKQ